MIHGLLLVVLALPQVFQDVLGIENFTKSDEAFAADALFLAYQSGTAEKVQAVVQVRFLFCNLVVSGLLGVR
jgi:hypothetical protein